MIGEVPNISGEDQAAMKSYQEGWEAGYRLGYETQPEMNRDYLLAKVERLEKQVEYYKELARR